MATAAAQQASAELTELERRGASPAARRSKLEQTLAAAKAKAAEPWAERMAGGRASVRDAHAAAQAFTSEHLDELVAELETEGEAAAERLTSSAEAVITAHSERERIAREIGELCSLAGARVRPGDVSYSRGEALVRAADDLLQAGGEEPPRLRRDPREPIHGVGAPAEVA